MNLQQAFFLLTNRHDEPVLELYHHLNASSRDGGHLVLAYHQTEEDIPEAIQQLNHFTFTNDVLSQLGYISTGNEVYLNTYFALLDFYLKNPSYDYYWYIEDDVKFTGDWNCLFNFYTEHPIQPDFISSHMYTFADGPAWGLWDTLCHPSNYIPMYLRIRSFSPIFRISNAALRCIHNAMIDQWRGHQEVLLPTILDLEGFHIADFGGRGPFVLPGQEDKFYISSNFSGCHRTGTMRFRPLIDPSEIKIKDRIYHPVKPWAVNP